MILNVWTSAELTRLFQSCKLPRKTRHVISVAAIKEYSDETESWIRMLFWNCSDSEFVKSISCDSLEAIARQIWLIFKTRYVNWGDVLILSLF